MSVFRLVRHYRSLNSDDAQRRWDGFSSSQQFKQFLKSRDGKKSLFIVLENKAPTPSFGHRGKNDPRYREPQAQTGPAPAKAAPGPTSSTSGLSSAAAQQQEWSHFGTRGSSASPSPDPLRYHFPLRPRYGRDDPVTPPTVLFDMPPVPEPQAKAPTHKPETLDLH